MSFTRFHFNSNICSALKSNGYTTPTPIQKNSITPILEGRDLIGLAQTGTGKTAAFVLPILQRLSARHSDGSPRALIIAPTRELAEQTYAYTVRFSRGLNLRSCVIYGGVSREAQIRTLKRGADIVIACPGRLLDLANDGAIDLSKVEILVLDEADQMLDRGFLPDIKRTVSKLPAKRQNLVFSATMPLEVRSLVEGLLTRPVEITERHSEPNANIAHTFYKVGREQKNALLTAVLQDEEVTTAIIFTKTKHKAKRLAQRMQKQGLKAVSIQGNLSQQKRQKALGDFKNGRCDFLVATDIAARGIDVADISHIINYDMPATAESYTHRTGRTGRAHKKGEALTFATPDDYKMIGNLERVLREKITYKTALLSESDCAAPEPRESRNQRPRKTRRNEAPKKTRGKKSSQRNRMAAFDFGI